MQGNLFVRARRAAPVRRSACRALLALVLAACGDGPSGSQPVDRVVIGGAAQGPVLVGTVVQMSATPRDAGGSALSSPVSWASSDNAIATVSASGLVSVVGAGSVDITASSGGKSASATLDARAGGPIPPAGGTLTMLGGQVTLTTLGGAVGPGVTLLVRPATSAPQDARLVPGTAFELGPEGLEFHQPATLSLAYDPARLPAGLPESSLRLFIFDGGAWRLLPGGGGVNTATRKVSGSVWGGGVFAVGGSPASRVTLEGTPRGVALYAGQSFTAVARAFDANNDSIRGRPFTWTSSGTAVATVDAEGRVTAQGAGTATITAAMDQQQASITLAVLPPVVPAWHQAEEWGTYQGNARHDGHVNATLNPGAFRELWSRTVVGSTIDLNPVATGAGKVFVSTRTHFWIQRLLGLDAATGAEVWSRDFGSIALVGPPAYGNGRVYVQTGGHEDSFLWSLDAADGTVRFNSPFRNQFSRWKAPVVTSGSVFVGGGFVGGAYRFDATSGAEGFAVQLPQVDDWTPAVDAGRLMVYGRPGSQQDGGLSVLDAATGALDFWVNDARLPTAGTPVVGGANNVLTIHPLSGTLSSTSLQARAVGWAVQDLFQGTPAVEGGVIYVRNQLKLDARRESDGTLLWSWTPPEGAPGGNIVLTDNLLFVTVNTSFTQATYAVDRASGRHVWYYPAGGHLALSAQGTLFIVGSSGTLTAIAVR